MQLKEVIGYVLIALWVLGLVVGLGDMVVVRYEADEVCVSGEPRP